MRDNMVFPQRRLNHTSYPSPPRVGRRLPVQNSNQSTILNMIQNPSQTKGSLASLTNKGIDGLSKTLTNVQQVLKVIESTAPIIEQYGPMVKNLPAMYKIIKSLKEYEDLDESSAEVPSSDSLLKDEATKENTAGQNVNTVEHEGESKKDGKTNQGKSVPVLFI